jgi:hypothetical protein
LTTRYHRQITIGLIAVFALISSGNVVMHRIAAWNQCGCLDHAAAIAAECACGHHEESAPAAGESTQQIGSDSECYIGRYFRQPTLDADAFELPRSCEAVTLHAALPIATPDVVVRLAFWSRGPPVSS